MPVTSDGHLSDRLNLYRLIMIGNSPLDEEDCKDTLLLYGSIQKLEMTADRRAVFVDFECEHAPLLVARCYTYNKWNTDYKMPKGVDYVVPGCSIDNFLYLQHIPRSVSTLDLQQFFSQHLSNFIIHRPGGTSQNPFSRAVIELYQRPANTIVRDQLRMFNVTNHQGKKRKFYAIPLMRELLDLGSIDKSGGCDECNVDPLLPMMLVEDEDAEERRAALIESRDYSTSRSPIAPPSRVASLVSLSSQELHLNLDEITDDEGGGEMHPYSGIHFASPDRHDSHPSVRETRETAENVSEEEKEEREDRDASTPNRQIEEGERECDISSLFISNQEKEETEIDPKYHQLTENEDEWRESTRTFESTQESEDEVSERGVTRETEDDISSLDCSEDEEEREEIEERDSDDLLSGEEDQWICVGHLPPLSRCSRLLTVDSTPDTVEEEEKAYDVTVRDVPLLTMTMEDESDDIARDIIEPTFSSVTHSVCSTQHDELMSEKEEETLKSMDEEGDREEKEKEVKNVDGVDQEDEKNGDEDTVEDDWNTYTAEKRDDSDEEEENVDISIDEEERATINSTSNGSLYDKPSEEGKEIAEMDDERDPICYSASRGCPWSRKSEVGSEDEEGKMDSDEGVKADQMEQEGAHQQRDVSFMTPQWKIRSGVDSDDEEEEVQEMNEGGTNEKQKEEEEQRGIFHSSTSNSPNLGTQTTHELTERGDVPSLLSTVHLSRRSEIVSDDEEEKTGSDDEELHEFDEEGRGERRVHQHEFFLTIPDASYLWNRRSRVASDDEEEKEDDDEEKILAIDEERREIRMKEHEEDSVSSNSHFSNRTIKMECEDEDALEMEEDEEEEGGKEKDENELTEGDQPDDFTISTTFNHLWKRRSGIDSDDEEEEEEDGETVELDKTQDEEEMDKEGEKKKITGGEKVPVGRWRRKRVEDEEIEGDYRSMESEYHNWLTREDMSTREETMECESSSEAEVVPMPSTLSVSTWGYGTGLEVPENFHLWRRRMGVDSDDEDEEEEEEEYSDDGETMELDKTQDEEEMDKEGQQDSSLDSEHVPE